MNMSIMDDINTLPERLQSCYGDRSSNETKTIRQQLIECEQEIAITLTKLDKLRKEQGTLQAAIAACQSLQSPVQLLPPEILSHVFVLLNEDLGGISIFTEFGSDLRIPALPLGQVCSFWRNVVLSTTELWSTLQIWLYGSEITGFIVQRCLERSKNAGLDLEISGISIGTKAFEYLVKHSYRWRRVTLRVDADVYADPVLERIRGNLPILEYLHVQNDVGCKITSPIVQDLFSQAPQLRSFCADTSVGDYICLGGTQSKVLNLDLSTIRMPETLRHCLSLSPNIETLSIDSWNDHPDLTLPPLTLPTLRELSIGSLKDRRCETAALAFHMLTLPHLATLEINGSVGRHGLPGDIPSFLQRSACNITSLTLQGLYGAEVSGIVSLLELLPSLETLIVSDKYHLHPALYPKKEFRFITPSFLRCFRRPLEIDSSSVLSTSTDWGFLPKLTTLKVTVMHAHVAETSEELKEMLKAGRRGDNLSSPGRTYGSFGYLGPVELREWKDRVQTLESKLADLL